MRLKGNIIKFALSVALLAPLCSKAQFIDRIEVGYSYVTATGQYQGTSGYYALDGTYAGDTAVKRNIKAKAGYGYDIGYTIPLKRVGRINMWGLSIHFVASEFIWGDLNDAYSASGTFSQPAGGVDLGGATLQLGVPIGIDYKLGTDAICSKRTRFGFTLGGGVMPSFSETVMLNFSGSGAGGGFTFATVPYVKAEVAVFAGICFKIKAQYTFGDIPYIDQTKSLLAVTDGPFKVTGKSTTALSLILMPFAWHWKEKEWFNTYGHYNKYQ